MLYDTVDSSQGASYITSQPVNDCKSLSITNYGVFVVCCSFYQFFFLIVSVAVVAVVVVAADRGGWAAVG